MFSANKLYHDKYQSEAYRRQYKEHAHVKGLKEGEELPTAPGSG